MTDLKFIDAQYSAILPWPDVAGSYYEIDNGPIGLEQRVVDLISRSGPSVVTLRHALVAKLVARLRMLGAEWAQRRALIDPPLVVSTGLDLGFERAFILAGIPFTRIVHTERREPSLPSMNTARSHSRRPATASPSLITGIRSRSASTT